MSDFSYAPAFGWQQKKSPRVRSAAFGDGYEQRVADGINTAPQVWDLTFNRGTSDITAIEAQLAGYGGVTAFTWTPPVGSEIKVLCREWTRLGKTMNGETLSVRFEQVFES